MIDEELEPGQADATSEAGANDATGGPEQPETTPQTETTAEPPGETEGGATEEPQSMAEALEDEGLRAEYDQTFRSLHRGQLLQGTVVHVDADRVFVDLGGKTEGVVPLGELSAEPLDTAEGYLEVGDEISVVVLQPDSADGNPVLSKKRADFEDTWNRIVDSFNEKETIIATVTERVKGGLLVDLGVRGFVPATHVGNGKLRNIERFVGETLPFKILEIDRDRRKVVLSNRLAEEERRRNARKEIFHTLQPGDIVDGTVRRIVDYGAFVDVGGVDGLLHVSEIAWTRVEHPSEVLKEGEQIKVKVLRLDPDAGKISLGYRQVLPDPWRIVGEKYRVGQIIEVPITRVVQSGAFVKLEQGVEAWLPVSEMADRRVKKPSEVVKEGDTIQVQVIEVRTQQRRMVVSLRALEQKAERTELERHMRTGRRAGSTIGERLGALKDLLRPGEDTEGEEAAEEAAEEAVETEAQAEAQPEPETAEAEGEVEAAEPQPEGEPEPEEEPAAEAEEPGEAGEEAGEEQATEDESPEEPKVE